MNSKGTHNWNIVIHYHRCTNCGKIFESRDDYIYRFGKYIKEIECPNCHYRFTLIKPVNPTFGPFWGK